jgi:hypothetical protein
MALGSKSSDIAKGSMPRLLIKAGNAQPQSLELRAGINRLGRSDANDFPIDHPTISGLHCEIMREGDSVYVRDLGSTNGTFIDGKRIKEGLLETGQMLQLGDVKMVLEAAPVAVTIPEFNLPQLPEPAFLPDGAWSCENHPQVRATERCTRCGHVFCETCTHHVRRVGGKFLNLCPLCSGPCAVIPGQAKPKKKTVWSRLRETLRMTFKR